MTNRTRGNSPILLVGANGQVGWELQRTLAPLGQVVAASLEGEYGPSIDLADADAIRGLVDKTEPWAIVNAAAYTAVDPAEKDVEQAHRINAEAVGVLGLAAKERGIPIVHYSTDFVFSGESDRPYTEEDKPAPLNVYGKTKLAGEEALEASGGNALIFRTSWVYGARGSNFLLTMRRLFMERDALSIVDDQIGAPTWSRMLAECTAQVLYRVSSGGLDIEKVKGIYHLTAGGQTSWFGFACAILGASSDECKLTPIRSTEYPAPARRPAYSVLDNSRFQRTFGLKMPDWHMSLAQCLEELD